jgi:DNA-binding NtrC family response regulator
MIVDDEPLIRINLAAFLEDEGYLVRVACSGEQALEFLGNQAVEVAIVDLRLPGLDGNSFILEAARICPSMRFLIHTGSMEYQVPFELMPLGVSARDVLLKPVRDMQKFIEEIQRRINGELVI